MKEIESNNQAWSKLAEEHYKHYKKELLEGTHKLNPIITRELPDLSGKRVIHLQCNTGADSLLLAKLADHVTGVDISRENVFFARKMAEELGYENTDFIACDVLEIADKLNEKYDMVFTSEGVLGWLPDLDKWAQNVRACLKDDGVFYIFDSHPFYMMLDESKLEKEEYFVKYPYFGKQPDVDDTIGGYASEPVGGVKAYFWMHTVSEIINSLIGAGLHIVFFNEYTFNFFDSGGMSPSKAEGLWEYPYNEDKYPMSYSLMATVYPGRRERK